MKAIDPAAVEHDHAVRQHGLAGLFTVLLLAGGLGACASGPAETATNSQAATSLGGSGEAYENPKSPSQVWGPASCGASLPDKTLASIGLSVSLTPTPGEFQVDGVRWTGRAVFRNGGEVPRTLSFGGYGARAVLVDEPGGRVLTASVPGGMSPATMESGDVAPGGSVPGTATIDSYRCPPPGDARLHADGEVDLDHVADGSHTVVVVMTVGQEAYRSEPIEVVLGKS